MTTQDTDAAYAEAMETAAELLGARLEPYAGAARAFDSYRIVREVFAERSAATS